MPRTWPALRAIGRPDGPSSRLPLSRGESRRPGLLGVHLSPSFFDEVYADEPWLSIRWDSEHKCVYAEWKGFATTVEFRAGLMKGLQAIREKQAVSYVSDARKIKVIVGKDQQWVNETWIPLAAAVGLKRLAIVLAGSGMGKIAVEETVSLNDNERGVLSRTFTSVPQAMTWLAVRDNEK